MEKLGGSEIQSYPQLHSKFKASLCYMRPYPPPQKKVGFGYGYSYDSRKWQLGTSTTIAGHTDAGQQGPEGYNYYSSFSSFAFLKQELFVAEASLELLTLLPLPLKGWDSQCLVYYSSHIHLRSWDSSTLLEAACLPLPVEIPQPSTARIIACGVRDPWPYWLGSSLEHFLLPWSVVSLLWLIAGFYLSTSALHPSWVSSVLFLPALAVPCPMVQVPLTTAASVIVTADLKQLLPVSAAMLPLDCFRGSVHCQALLSPPPMPLHCFCFHHLSSHSPCTM